ncbi:unnamed protein product [marine sediment metagenome]|uniref:50S ribosomal protein L21 n=1 Tax=marine sediment metagenome TaxID=412755 RepID=X1LCF9_9ZZZZ
MVLDKVLLVKHDGKTVIGTPTVSGAKVISSVARQTRGEKIRVFKKKPKKGYRRTIGHRQYLTELKIEKISYEPKK